MSVSSMGMALTSSISSSEASPAFLLSLKETERVLMVSPANYVPRTFTLMSECPMAADTFQELTKRYFEMTHSPYYFFLLEDEDKASTLCDAQEATNWLLSNFVSPITRKACEKVYIVIMRHLADTPSFMIACCNSQELKERLQLIQPANDNALVDKKAAQAARKAIFQSLKQTICTDDEFLNIAHLILQHNSEDQEIQRDVLDFLSQVTKESVDDRKLDAQFDYLQKKMPLLMYPLKKDKITSQELAECLKKRAQIITEKTKILFADFHQVQHLLGEFFWQGTPLLEANLQQAKSCFEKIFKSAISANYEDYAVYYTSLAQVERKLGNFQSAQVHLNSALSLNPNHLLALCELVDLLIQTDDLIGAKKQIQLICRFKNPCDRVKKTLHAFEQAEEQAVNYAKKALNDEPQSDDEFLRRCIQTLSLQPDDEECLTMLFKFLTTVKNENKDEVERAKSNITKVAQALENNLALQSMLGALYYSGNSFIEQNYHQAIAFYKKVTAQDKKNGLAFFHSGMIQYSFGEDQNAQASLEAALAINPKNVTALRTLADICRLNKAYSTSNFYLNQAEELDPADDPVALRCKAENLRCRGEFVQARVVAEKALMHDDQSAFAQATYGAILVELNEWQLAKVHLQLALKLNPDYPFAQNKLDIIDPPKKSRCSGCVIL